MLITNSKKIKEILTSGVQQVLPSRKDLTALMKKRKIRVYWGIDPTGERLHLGHAIPLRKLRQFQDLGHEVVLLVGSFTAQLGDPSERDKKRKVLTMAQVKKNMKNYVKQAGKILDTKKIKIRYNGDWLSKLAFNDLVKLSSYFTVSRLLERDMFQRRLKSKKEVWLSELLYPLMQGYDSVEMNVDLEIGGNDQLFNMLIGRKLQRIYNNKEKFILTTDMLIGLDGREMGKTYGNVVNITDKPNDMYGKIMSLKDSLIMEYFRLCTEASKEYIKKAEQKLKSKKVNPKKLKARLAKAITTIYHGEKKAESAEKEFNRVFAEKKLPSKIREVKIGKKNLNILELLVETKQASSKSEAKRLILQKSVEIEGDICEDWRRNIRIKKGMIVRVGKRRFVKIK